LILPASGVNPEIVARLADISASASNKAEDGQLEFPKGLLEYRQARFASAVEWMQKVLSKTGNDPFQETRSGREVEAFMVLAMAQYQSRQIDNARSALARGIDAEAKLPKLDSGDLRDWPNWVIAHALMGEAKALIEGGENR